MVIMLKNRIKKGTVFIVIVLLSTVLTMLATGFTAEAIMKIKKEDKKDDTSDN